MIAATLRGEPTRLTGRGPSGGDAQERAATNPVAALPCARTPLLDPLLTPLLHPLLAPPSATVGVTAPASAPFRQVRVSDPGRGPPPPPPPPPAGVSGEAGAVAGHSREVARWRVCVWSAPH
jgi:hypothetical protein